jgi:hypothetical protein
MWASLAPAMGGRHAQSAKGRAGETDLLKTIGLSALVRNALKIRILCTIAEKLDPDVPD